MLAARRIAYVKRGRPTSARGRIEKALQEFKETAGGIVVRDLSKATIAHHRDRLFEQEGLTAYGVNKKITELKRLASWAEERGYVSEAQATSLSRL